MALPCWINYFSHRRFNPLIGEWKLVSPHRTRRPWSGQVENDNSEKQQLRSYDFNCCLCPGNTRNNNINKNPKYKKTFVFTNDNPSFSLNIENANSLVLKIGNKTVPDFIKLHPEQGICRVVCYSPQHNMTMSCMKKKEIVEIIKTWQKEYKKLGKLSMVNHVQIFENKGLIMGCSQPHPHGQIWAQKSIPTEPKIEQFFQQKYIKKHKIPLLLDYVNWEIKEKQRIVCLNKDFVVLVPFWATWPFETMILPTSNINNILQLKKIMVENLANILSRITRIYDKIFYNPFPYSMGIHQSPTDKKQHPEWIMHFHFYPPLLRSINIKKFMVGYEMLAEEGRDVTPEKIARKLRDLNKLLS